MQTSTIDIIAIGMIKLMSRGFEAKKLQFILWGRYEAQLVTPEAKNWADIRHSFSAIADISPV